MSRVLSTVRQELSQTLLMKKWQKQSKLGAVWRLISSVKDREKSTLVTAMTAELEMEPE